jgi:hypothetical protein
MSKKSASSGAMTAAAAGLRVGQSETLAELVVGRGASPLRALSAFYWIAAWGLFVDLNEREPRNVDEVASSCGLKPRTAYNWQKAFRELFPEYSTPATLWELVHDQVPGDDPQIIGLQLGGATV